MKLEAIDPLNLGNICVATVCKVSLGQGEGGSLASPETSQPLGLFSNALRFLECIQGGICSILLEERQGCGKAGGLCLYGQHSRVWEAEEGCTSDLS